jgi:hypothetical protein
MTNRYCTPILIEGVGNMVVEVIINGQKIPIFNPKQTFPEGSLVCDISADTHVMNLYQMKSDGSKEQIYWDEASDIELINRLSKEGLKPKDIENILTIRRLHNQNKECATCATCYSFLRPTIGKTDCSKCGDYSHWKKKTFNGYLAGGISDPNNIVEEIVSTGQNKPSKNT